MSQALFEAQELLQKFIAPPLAGESMKVRIARAARCVGFTYGRTGTLWYGNARRVDASEIDMLRAAAVKKSAPTKTGMDSRGRDFTTIVAELKYEVAQLQSRIEQLDRISRDRG